MLCNNFYKAVSIIPQSLRDKLIKTAENKSALIEEIRLRANQPVEFTICGARSFTDIIVSRVQVNETFLNACNHSVYAHEEELSNGFVTTNDGNRIGICGRAVLTDGKITTIDDISSLNIRIAHSIKNAADKLYQYLNGESVLITGPPGCGKTTVLRDAVDYISKKFRVSVIDSRGEIQIASVLKNCDVFEYAPKPNGIEMAVRTLNPQYIAFDEIGSAEEAKLILNGLHSGVSFITTAHSGSIEDLKRCTFINDLLQSNVFSVIALIDKAKNIRIINSVKAEDICDESDRYNFDCIGGRINKSYS